PLGARGPPGHPPLPPCRRPAPAALPASLVLRPRLPPPARPRLPPGHRRLRPAARPRRRLPAGWALRRLRRGEPEEVPPRDDGPAGALAGGNRPGAPLVPGHRAPAVPRPPAGGGHQRDGPPRPRALRGPAPRRGPRGPRGHQPRPLRRVRPPAPPAGV